MKLSPRPLIAAVYAALLFPLYGQAQLYNYSYTDTRGTKVNAEPSREYLNPGSAITLNLISGLDRYERVTVTRSSDNVQMFRSVTDLVTVADRISAADGSEYYGKSIKLPVLGEGTFALKSETLDKSQMSWPQRATPSALIPRRPFYLTRCSGSELVSSTVVWIFSATEPQHKPFRY